MPTCWMEQEQKKSRFPIFILTSLWEDGCLLGTSGCIIP
ncbi:hypothetical protein EVA_16573 [gut metagenome]|uniref:Uncharacterized protein n=1 Tax=gut metagenome TaxID=749906 RepID=J9C647_9ZZZZ